MKQQPIDKLDIQTRISEIFFDARSEQSKFGKMTTDSVNTFFDAGLAIMGIGLFLAIGMAGLVAALHWSAIVRAISF